MLAHQQVPRLAPRYGKVNEHNAWVPRDHWLEDWEKQAIIRFPFDYPLEGYRRLAFMMLDRGRRRRKSQFYLSSSQKSWPA